MTIPEAATRLEVSQSTIRRRLRNGQLTGYAEPTAQGHRWLVEIPVNRDDVVTNGDSERGPLVEALEARISSMETELESRRREVDQLHQLLAAKALNPGSTKPWWRFWG